MMPSRAIALLVLTAFSVSRLGSTRADSLSVPPPVNSVNGSQGDVVVPTTQRQVSPALDATTGTVPWTFPSPFINPPTCWETLASTSTAYSFDVPIVTAISRTSVTLKVTAHPNALVVTSLALPISLPLTTVPPPGTTLTLSCVGALP